MKTILSRIYSDYGMPSRLTAYEKLICAGKEAGFMQTSVRNFFDSIHTGHPGLAKFIVHRHDIDTDLRTTRKLFEIEKKHGVQSSYYFRLSTLDFRLMREIEEYGSEASYHYEEIASFAKKYKIKDPDLVRSRLPEIRSIFQENFFWLEKQLGTKMRTVASHGDFANRRLKLNNNEILADRRLREECGIDCEAYDPEFLRHVDIYIADRPPPQYYCPISPLTGICQYQRICLLTHPRQVETNWKENTKHNISRIVEAVTW
jgi:hypothetical protein